MKKYVLLLRGINVGGKNKVVMKELKNTLEGVEFINVITYINSGNVIFDTEDNLDTVKQKVQKVLSEYPFKIHFVVLTKEDTLDEYSNLPKWWNESLARKDVLFYSDEVSYDEMKEKILQMPLYDEVVHFGNRAVFWGKYSESEYLKTSYHKYLLKEKFYPLITIRNSKTFEKIVELLG